MRFMITHRLTFTTLVAVVVIQRSQSLFTMNMVTTWLQLLEVDKVCMAKVWAMSLVY